MGGSKSKLSALTDALLAEYTLLTYLNKAEILYILKICSQMDDYGMLENVNSRYPCEYVEHIFKQLKFNPFRDRIFKVFSSKNDGKMSFEDILDLCSVMSEKCPNSVKAAWAFRIFDFNEDGCLDGNDIAKIIDRLTSHAGFLTDEEQNRIIKILLKDLDLENSGTVSIQEFIHVASKMTEFPHSFCFRF